MDKLTKLFQENHLDLKTMIILNKAIRTIRTFENQAAKQHNLTPTQFSVLETLYSKGNLRIQDLMNVVNFCRKNNI